MIELKNVRPGVLMIADAQVRLEPGQVVTVKSLTAQMEKALSLGMLARVGVPLDRGLSSLIPNLSGLTAKEAISIIAKEKDPNMLKAQKAGENRRSVLDAIDERLKEVTSGSR